MLDYLISFLSCFVVEPPLRLLSSSMSLPSAPELAFKKQAELAHEALQAFNVIPPLAASAAGPVKTALSEVVTAMVCPFSCSSPYLKLKFHFGWQVAFSGFTSNYLQHSLFQELPQAVQLAIEDFSSKNPDFELPAQTFQVSGLATRAKNAALHSSPAKKGVFSPFLYSSRSNSFIH
jgi:hypothetical protein